MRSFFWATCLVCMDMSSCGVHRALRAESSGSTRLALHSSSSNLPTYIVGPRPIACRWAGDWREMAMQAI